MRILVALAVAGVLVLAASAGALAKGPPSGSGGGQGGGGSHGGGGGGGGNGGGSSTPTGNDVSYPECGHRLPSSPAFAIVGLNGGLANDLNPCFQSELAWAAASTVGGTSQPNVQLYVNTADPGNTYNGQLIADWPNSDTITLSDATSTTVTPPDAYGTCAPESPGGTIGQNSTACAWVYGYWRAAQDSLWLTQAADAINSNGVPNSASSYPWWLDVETVNSWQTDTTMNVADLQGMLQALTDAGVSATSIGVYSTASQWSQIVGSSGSGVLPVLDDWVPGGSSLSDAQASCTSLTPFAGGVSAITQWNGHPDNDYAC